MRRLMLAAARRPLRVSGVVLGLALVAAVLALRLTPGPVTDSLVGRSSETAKATKVSAERFGEDAVYVLVAGRVSDLVLSGDIETLVGLEGCLAGNPPKGVTPVGGPRGPCGQLARDKPVKVVIGPATFLNESVGQINDQLATRTEAARKEAAQAGEAAFRLARGKGKSLAQARKLREQARELVAAQLVTETLQLAITYGITSPPQLNDQAFVSQLVFEAGKAPGTPKAKFAYLFPNATSALVQVRLRAGLSEPERRRAIASIRAATKMPRWKLSHGQRYVVTGAPVVVSDVSQSITSSIAVLLAGALLVMALVLAVVLRGRRRMAPLVVALAATALVFGLLSALGSTLTMASVGVVPVLIGLAVDYAIQLQSRLQELPAGMSLPARAEAVARRGAPTVAVAAAATAAGFLVLVLSPVPMVRGFGLLLVAGIVIALLVALTLGTALQAQGRGRLPGVRLASAGVRALRAADELVRGSAPARAVRAAGRRARDGALLRAGRRPARVLLAGLVLAAAGWALDTQTRVESDITKLVPRDAAVQDLQGLQRSTGIAGQVDVLVRADRLTDPEVVAWMTRYQDELLRHFGVSADRGCGRADVCAAFSLPDLFRDGNARTREQITGLLDAVPSYFSQSVITADRRTATLAFGLRLMPIERQSRVLAEMRSRLRPPAGVRAELVGLPVLAAQANDAVSSPWRRLLTLVAGLVAVGLVLMVALRSWRRALVPLVPIVLATGWSALVLFALRVPLNPMSVTLGALVIAISTEFSVLLSERYRAERAAGGDPAQALERAYGSTGAAVLASGATAIAGFAVLMLSDITMLRDFGAVTVIDLTVSLIGVLVVLPAVLIGDERGWGRAARRRLPRARPQPRRPRRRRPEEARAAG